MEKPNILKNTAFGLLPVWTDILPGWKMHILRNAGNYDNNETKLEQFLG